MRIGRCPSCARPFTSGEVAGFGILRARPESEGGPLMEFACPGCARRMGLIPYGHGRYALPGEPLPPPVPEALRAPPWVDRKRATGQTTAAPVVDEGEEERVEIPIEDYPPQQEGPPHQEVPPAASSREEAGEEAPLTLDVALEILGVSPTAERAEIEKAYRTRSRTCHPDKVAHLDEEFQALAERKFRRLHDAYELLIGS